MYSDAAIQVRIATLEASEAYTEILMLEHQPEDTAHAAARDHNDRAGAELRNQTTTAQNVIKGKAKDEYGALAGLDTGANQLYGLSDQRYLNKLFQYASENGDYFVKHYQQRGSYLYHSIRRAMDTPLEWSNTHLRYQVVAHIIKHVQFLFPLITVYNDKMEDGTITQQEREDYEAPGPFSLVTYLQAMLKGDFYADEITLIVISMMWQVRVTVLNQQTLHQIKIRHGNKIEKVDLAVAHCSGNHYIPLGECTVIDPIATAIYHTCTAIDVVCTNF